jgi:hypothetical protein
MEQSLPLTAGRSESIGLRQNVPDLAQKVAEDDSSKAVHNFGGMKTRSDFNYHCGLCQVLAMAISP